MAAATLIPSLTVSGVVDSTGAQLASGKVWLWLPGTTTNASIYADSSALTQLSNPLTLDASGRYPLGVYVTSAVRLAIYTAAGVLVSDTVFSPASAGAVALKNTGFMGVNPTTGAQAAGQETTVDAALTSLAASTGGVDAKYLESSGATARTIHDKFQELTIAAKDFGAKGDGIADDTTAIQAAVNRAAALGGGIVYLGPGTYLISAAITLTSKAGVSIVGAGIGATIIKATNGTQNAFTYTSCTSVRFEEFNLTHSSSSTGIGFAMIGGTDVLIDRVAINIADPTTDKFTGGSVSITGVTNYVRLISSTFSGGLTLNTSGTSANFYFDSLYVRGNTSFDGTATNVTTMGSLFFGTFTMAVSLSGVQFQFVGNYFASRPSLAMSTDPVVFQAGNRWAAYTASFAVGTSQQPDLTSGLAHLTASSGGVGTVTVGIAKPTIGTNRGPYYILFTNASGGAVTWTLNAVYKTNGSIPTTDGHTISVGFLLDNEAGGFLREFSRTDMVT